MIEKTKFPLFSDKFHAGKYEHVWLTVPLAKIRTIPQINRNFPKFHNSDLDFQKSYVDFQKIEVEETHKKKNTKTYLSAAILTRFLVVWSLIQNL